MIFIGPGQYNEEHDECPTRHQMTTSTMETIVDTDPGKI